MHGEATIDANPFLVLFTIILLTYHWVRHKYGHWIDDAVSHVRALMGEGYVEPKLDTDECNDCTTLAQAELERRFAGVIEPLDISMVLKANEDLIQSGERYSRKTVCRRAFNSVSSDAYSKTKAVLDTLEEIS